MSGLSTHVLDLASGRPAAGVLVEVYREGALIGRARTDGDGRCAGLQGEGPLLAGRYELVFAIGAYFFPNERAPFFAEARIAFLIAPNVARCHMPLLASPYGYSTYRGS